MARTESLFVLSEKKKKKKGGNGTCESQDSNKKCFLSIEYIWLILWLVLTLNQVIIGFSPSVAVL